MQRLPVWDVQVNLVATQLVLDREHPNRMVFEDGQGLDPNIDLKFRGPNLRALIQGKASTWQSHLTLTPTGGSGGVTPADYSPGPDLICIFSSLLSHPRMVPKRCGLYEFCVTSVTFVSFAGCDRDN